MISLGFLTIISTGFIMLVGLACASLLIQSLPISFQRGSTFLSISLLVGFAFFSIASSWSFGFLGTKYFLPLMILLVTSSIFLNIYLFLIKKRKKTKLTWSKFDFCIPILAICAIYSNRIYTDAKLGLGLRSGDGPDTAQNLMTFAGLAKSNTNWLNMLHDFLYKVDSPNIYDGLYKLYTVVSFREQATFDYMLYGVRWGLSVPFSYFYNLFGHDKIIIFPALISSIGFFSLGLIIYGMLSVMIRNLPLVAIISVSIISSGSIIYQTFNGGLAQAWSLPGLGALSIILLLLHNYEFKLKDVSTKIFLVLLAFSWIAIYVSYLDLALVILLLFFMIEILRTTFTRFRSFSWDRIKIISFGGLISLIIVLPFSLVGFYTLPIRLRLASGTGILSPNWPLPSELLGIGNVWTEKRTPLALLIAIIFSILLILYFFGGIKAQKKSQVVFSEIGSSSIIILAIAFCASFFSKANNNYIYIKVGAYLLPILVTSFFVILTSRSAYSNHEILIGALDRSEFQNAKKSKFLVKNLPYASIFLTLLIITSAQMTISKLVPQSVFFPKNFGQITTDKTAQKKLTEYNYFLFYTPSSNMLGVFGDIAWISKAPNDLNLTNRLDREIRVLCYSFNNLCLPPGEKIIEPSLEKYGLISYRTNISSKAYSELSILAKYEEAFKQTGQKPFKVPDRFVGGNPLLKG